MSCTEHRTVNPSNGRRATCKYALVSGPTGYEALETLIAEAPAWLDPSGGALVLELAPHQADRAHELATVAGFVDVRVDRDLVGRARCSWRGSPEPRARASRTPDRDSVAA